MLAYCRSNKGKVHFLVVFNLTRFARDKYDHFALRSHLKSLGISLRSSTEPIDDTSTGKLMEGVLAAFAQFDNDVRSDRTSVSSGSRKQVQTVTNYRRCRRANSTPDPDLRYFSNATARRSSPNLNIASTSQGRCFAVCGQRPAL